MIRILQVVGKMHRAGMETLLMNIYRNIDRTKVQFDFCVHYPEKGEYDDEIKRLGGHIYYMPKFVPNSFVELSRKVDQLIAKHHEEYVAVHVHFSCVGFLYFNAAKKYGIKYRIYHAHNSGREKGLHGNLRYMLEQISIRKSNIRFACSDLAGQYNFHRNNYLMLNNGVDVQKFKLNADIRLSMRSEYGIESKTVYLNVGRIDVQKNQGFLLDIFNSLYETNNNIELFVLGDGPYRQELINKADSLVSNQHIHFMGNRDDVEAFMDMADAFLLPSLYEGLPLTLIEAQAAGLQCFVSNTITREADVTEDRVRYLPLDNINEWVKNLLSVSPADRFDTSDEVIKSGFDCRDVATKMERFYLKLQ